MADRPYGPISTRRPSSRDPLAQPARAQLDPRMAETASAIPTRPAATVVTLSATASVLRAPR